jgi:hypothetical protein
MLFAFSVTFAKLALSESFDMPLNAQLRLDDRSGKETRTQYRLRLYPRYTFDDANWSINSFLSTGDDFSGSHNTVDPKSTNNFYMRRLFARYKDTDKRIEFGVIPTYKGRVSSSGLSKNGFIKGFRGVLNTFEDTEMELVLGSLNDTSAKNALSLPDKLDYIELEISRRINATASYELSLERMAGSNYVRTEYRIKTTQETDVFVEWIKRVDNLDDKFVLGVTSQFALQGLPIDMHAYYTYASQGIGARAELTEDFISTGSGLSVELETPIQSSKHWNAFIRFDAYRHNTRFLFGVAVKI